MADIYSLEQLVGKAYIPTRDVGITRGAYDGAPIVFTVKAGASAGNVYSALGPASGRRNAWLMFYDSNERPYYVEIQSGQTDTTALQQQGAQTVQQQAAAAAAAAKAAEWDALSIQDKIMRIAKYGVIAAIVIYGIKEILPMLTRKNSVNGLF